MSGFSARRPRGTDSGAHWISYSDMMAAILMVFVLAVVYSVYQYNSLLMQKTRELETQMLFIANVVEAKVLSSAPSCTYSYYHAHIKPKKNPAPEQKECWVCKICGYVYEGAELPADFVCPLCKHGRDDFTPAGQ